MAGPDSHTYPRQRTISDLECPNLLFDKVELPPQLRHQRLGAGGGAIAPELFELATEIGDRERSHVAGAALETVCRAAQCIGVRCLDSGANCRYALFAVEDESAQ